MTLEKLYPGLTLYDVKRNTRPLRTWKWDVWPVIIKEVNAEKRTVLASWNHNTPRTYTERSWSKWRLKEPKE